LGKFGGVFGLPAATVAPAAPIASASPAVTATAASIATTATATAAVPAVSTTATATAILLRATFLGFVDAEVAAHQVGTVHFLNGFAGLVVVGQGDKGEATRTLGFAVERDEEVIDGSVGGEGFANVVIGSGERQIAKIQFHSRVIKNAAKTGTPLQLRPIRVKRFAGIARIDWFFWRHRFHGVSLLIAMNPKIIFFLILAGFLSLPAQDLQPPEAPEPGHQDGPQVLTENIAIRLQGSLGKGPALDLTLAGAGPEFSADVVIPGDSGLLNHRYIVLAAGEKYRIEYSLNMRLPVETKVGERVSLEYRDLTLSGTVLLEKGEKVVIARNGEDKLTLGVDLAEME